MEATGGLNTTNWIPLGSPVAGTGNPLTSPSALPIHNAFSEGECCRKDGQGYGGWPNAAMMKPVCRFGSRHPQPCG
jgi:hypothetical protein